MTIDQNNNDKKYYSIETKGLMYLRRAIILNNSNESELCFKISYTLFNEVIHELKREEYSFIESVEGIEIILRCLYGKCISLYYNKKINLYFHYMKVLLRNLRKFNKLYRSLTNPSNLISDMYDRLDNIYSSILITSNYLGCYINV